MNSATNPFGMFGPYSAPGRGYSGHGYGVQQRHKQALDATQQSMLEVTCAVDSEVIDAQLTLIKFLMRKCELADKRHAEMEKELAESREAQARLWHETQQAKQPINDSPHARLMFVADLLEYDMLGGFDGLPGHVNNIIQALRNPASQAQ